MTVNHPVVRSRKRWTRDRIENQTLRILRPLIIAVLIVVTVLPFYYMGLLSVRSLADVMRDPGALFVEMSRISMAGYENVIAPVSAGGQDFLGFVRNSAILAVGTVIVSIAVAIPGAYAVSRLRFFGRRQISALFLAVYLFPSILLAVPLFVFFTRVGMRGSFVALLLVYVSQSVAISIYMLRNYFQTIPRSLEEAAAIDGCNRLGIMWRISFPLALPSIMANGLYVFMHAWNEFLFALLFLVEDRERWTVSLGLSQLTGNSIEIPPTVLMAASVLTTIPIVIIFFASERMLTEGLTAGAEKG